MTTQADVVRSPTEVPEKARRRRFTAEYKRRILREADACTKTGEHGALLRREGLYSSNLAAWRVALRDHGQKGLEPQKRGPQERPPAGNKDRKHRAARAENRRLTARAENRRLTARAERAEALVNLQKKVAALLGQPPTDEDEPS